MRSRAPASIFAIILGIFLLAEGIWGLFSPVVFGAFTTNQTHAIIHIVLGFLGLALGIRDRAREYLGIVGVILVAAGVLRLIPETAPYPIEYLRMNVAAAYANIAIGAGAIVFAMIPRPRTKVVIVEERPVRRRLVTNV